MDIASLTSCPKRFLREDGKWFNVVLNSIIHQNLNFDKVILNLNKNEYDILKANNIQLPKDERFELHIVDEKFGDIRSFKKFIPTVKWYIEECDESKKSISDRIYIFDDDFLVNPIYHLYIEHYIVNNTNYHTQNEVIGVRYNPLSKYVGRLDATQMPASASSYPLKHFTKDFYENFNQELAEKFNFEDELYYCLYAKKKGLGGIVTNLTFNELFREVTNNETSLGGKYCNNFIDGNPCKPRTNEIYKVVEEIFGFKAPNYLLPYCIYDNTNI